MGHAVYHRTASGEAQLEDVSSLEAALELVERLRNEEGPTEIRLLKEIPVEVRTYYRVVAAVDDESSEPKTTAAATEVVVDVEPAEDAIAEGTQDANDEVVADEPVAEVDEPAVEVADVDVADLEVAEDEAPVVSSTLSEPPAGAMPLLSPPPSVTVHAGDDAGVEPAAAASGSEGRPRLFNRS